MPCTKLVVTTFFKISSVAQKSLDQAWMKQTAHSIMALVLLYLLAIGSPVILSYSHYAKLHFCFRVVSFVKDKRRDSYPKVDRAHLHLR